MERLGAQGVRGPHGVVLGGAAVLALFGLIGAGRIVVDSDSQLLRQEFAGA